MIPKIIHYCWFGGAPLSNLAIQCIESWKKYLPDYEIRLWNESNFNVNIIPYTSEAYQVKKYAFVSDYARFWILYNYGGVYFDTDVEVIRPLHDIIENGPFMGCECEASNLKNTSTELGVGLGVNPGLGFAATPGLKIFKDLLDVYGTLHFFNQDGSYNTKTIVQYTTEMLCEYGLKNTSNIQECSGVLIYPKEYFCPKDYYSGYVKLTEHSYSIHHYDASWINDEKKYALKLQRKLNFLPLRMASYLSIYIAAIKFRGFIAALKDIYNWVIRLYEK